MQRKANMQAIASAMASAAASAGSATSRAQLTPTSAATRLPPMMDHGCASGLDGTANNNTAEAPIGAISHTVAASCGNISTLNSPVSKIPNKAPAQARMRSKRSTADRCGMKLLSHCRIESRMPQPILGSNWKPQLHHKMIYFAATRHYYAGLPGFDSRPVASPHHQ